MVQECKQLSAKPTDKTGQKPTRTRISEKWRNSRNSQNTQIYKTKFGFGIHIAIVLSTAETHTGGGTVLGKPEGSPARRHSRNIDLKQTFAYADIQTNEE